MPLDRCSIQTPGHRREKLAAPVGRSHSRNSACKSFVLGIIACVGIALTLFSLLFGFRSVPTNSVGVKLWFGAFAGIAEPGLTYVIPYVDELIVVPTQRLLKLEFGFSTAGATNPYQHDRDAEDTETMITGDLNTALVPWVVQYRITDPRCICLACASRRRPCATCPRA
jgi:modulator of FtsH protease HflK